ncbi:class I SAM-dependent methyltransferase [bacterium]|nr:class I SAM-dependent methyltransferase [bacterium]
MAAERPLIACGDGVFWSQAGDEMREFVELTGIPIYARRVFLKRFLAHYEIFQKIANLPGDIVELGVYRGATLLSWANFLEIRNMGDRQRRVIGFDNFKGFGAFDPKDGAPAPEVGKKAGGFDGGAFEESLRDAIRIFDADRFIPYKARVVLVKGDIEETVPKYVSENPGLRVSLLHFDVDLYRPTLAGLQALWPLVVPGGAVLFDEYGIPPWEGESKAVDEFFGGKVELRRFEWSSNPGAYVIKSP